MRSLSVPLCAILILCLASVSGATNYLVRPDGLGDLPTIREAVAVAVDGDVIELTDGTFDGDGNRDVDFLGKAITIRSQNGNPDLCIIDCGGSSADPHRGFLFHLGEGPGSSLDGISVTGGYASPALPFGRDGGAVYCASSAPLLHGCAFANNTAEGNGGGLYCYNADPVIDTCDFIGNDASQGGGIDCDSGTVLAIRSCRLIGNAANNNGGGIRCQRTTTNINDCRFEDNTATSGAGLMCSDGLVTIGDSFFHVNVADWYGGALWGDSDATLIVEECGLISNYAGLSGGGVHCSGATTMITSCTLYGNTAANGGGVRSGVGGAVTLDRSIIAFGIRGGGVGCSIGGEVNLSCCDIYGNVDGDWVGCIEGDDEANGNLSEDPMFCDAVNGDFSLHSNSACALANNPGCGYIGAWPVGCGDVTLVEVPQDTRQRSLRVFPNPSHGVLEIEFHAPATGPVTVQVLDITGRVIRALSAGAVSTVDAGESVMIWDGRDDQGHPVPSGVYIAKIRGPHGIASGRLIVSR